jgi:hypothetical protein
MELQANACNHACQQSLSPTKFPKKSKTYVRNASTSHHQHLNQHAPNTHNTQQEQQKTNQTTTTSKSNNTPSTAIRNIKKGTAPGPFTHSTDFIRACALARNKRQEDNTCTCPDAFIQILNITTNNELSQTTSLNFGSQCFTALCKDINDLKKKRPISIGTALRRKNSATLLEHHRNDIAQFCAPDGQHGIATKGGLEFIVHKAQAQCLLFVDKPNKQKEPVSRVPLLLDITNMFNEISRDACRLLLLATPELKDIVPHFDQTCKEPNRCWHNTDKGACRHFQQSEGFAQGCPLSGSCAAIVLSLLLKKINKELIARQNQNSDIPSPHTGSFIDDTNLFLPLQDVEWFIKRFNELGTPTGVRSNQRKTQLLVGPLTHMSAKQQETLTHLTTILQPEKMLTEGCKLLGQAIGTSTCATNHMKQQATKHRTAASRMTPRLLDRQTISSIHRCCAQPHAT